MQDGPHGLPFGRVPRTQVFRSGAETGVIDFASWVVDLLAARRAAADGVMRPEILDRLVRAVVQPEPEPLAALLRDLVRQKVSAVAIADLYIPAAAAQLGDDWMEDRAGFAEVTLATARMQAMLRALGAAWSADRSEPGTGHCILLCVAPGERHTLGALVLLGQLRRSGVSVRLVLDPAAEDLPAMMAATRFDAALVSASGSVRLADLAKFVETLRRLAPRAMPVVIGGGVLGVVPEAVALVGADGGAMEVAQALVACGLTAAGEGRARLRA